MNTSKALILMLGAGFALPVLATAASVVTSPPPCEVGSLAEYEDLSSGCTIGPNPTFTYTNFSFQTLSGSSAVLNPADIEVTPSSSQGVLRLIFSSSGFSAGAYQTVEYSIGYTVDPPPPEIIRFGAAVDPPANSGTAQVTSDICVYAAFKETACPAPGVPYSLTVTSSSPNATTPDFSPVAVVLGVDDLITLSDGGSFSSFGNRTLVVGQVPEPASWLLAALGFVLVLCLAVGAKAKVR